MNLPASILIYLVMMGLHFMSLPRKWSRKASQRTWGSILRSYPKSKHMVWYFLELMGKHNQQWHVKEHSTASEEENASRTAAVKKWYMQAFVDRGGWEDSFDKNIHLDQLFATKLNFFTLVSCWQEWNWNEATKSEKMEQDNWKQWPVSFVYLREMKLDMKGVNSWSMTSNLQTTTNQFCWWNDEREKGRA